ncbi:MAG: toll/interleukin-1 receptor domain-containing protein [Oscillospiraceae bacterium]
MKTKVFISWSGKETKSFKVAKKLCEWLPIILQSTEPFMSDNIAAGTDFISQIMSNLSSAKVGIICITKENVTSPWLNFEAGALSNVVIANQGVAIPILIGMTTDELSKCSSPIKNFQAVEFNESGINKMLSSVNQYIENKLSDNQLNMLLSNSKSILFDDQQENNCSVVHERQPIVQEEPEYIKLLREIVNKYKLSQARPLMYNTGEYSVDDMMILVDNGYIKCRRYLNGSLTVEPTGIGLKYVTDNFHSQ